MNKDALVFLVNHIEWHRNGIGGEGFYAVHFQSTDKGGDGRAQQMIAILHSEPGYCSVVTPGNPEQCWRGDNFEPELVARIRAREMACYGSAEFREPQPVG